MRLKRRLQVTAATMVILPILLLTIAFLVIGGIMNKGKTGSIASDNRRFGRMAEGIFARISHDMEDDPDILSDTVYLDKVNEELGRAGAYLLVRRGDDLIYSGKEAYMIDPPDTLPEYTELSDTSKSIVYSKDSESGSVRWYNFRFPGGDAGTIFIILSIQSLISPSFLGYMCIAILVIMMVTSFLLTGWIREGIFRPIDELSKGMQKITEGNFDFRLNDNHEKGEIGEMYRSYEDMRLRLKESAEEKLEHEHQNKELIRNISHDLKTPITTIRGYAEGLMEGVAATPEKQHKYLMTIYNKANDMNNLINELTLYSSIDNNRIPYNFHRINVCDYFGDCVEELGMDMEGRGIKLNYSNLTSPDTLVVADPEQMKRVINNIVSNSVKYMDRTDGKGEIDIRILDEVDSIRVEIEDNGRGIPQRDLGNIFERFYRADSSRNSKHSGSGIGLSIVKKIIEDHGGYIWATSHEGEGTTMHFVLRKYVEKMEDYNE
ncbi:sensor histidine kinase [Butyrivibrio sp. MC2013]|uniref:sensor histidine kinase n=1 Tax=Butyrivibrio sp. MC2013 TaxID=1280686 RepID=UPI0004792902|nr:HAMP domain-containing sensor histidine kinase [Butyrivibrio sp. MC2013]